MRPGLPTAIACTIAIALATVGLDGPQPDPDTAAAGLAGAGRPAPVVSGPAGFGQDEAAGGGAARGGRELTDS